MAGVCWISHRGFHEQHVENTQRAFDAAVELGFDCLETDLRTTLDGRIVLHHDPHMRRTANQSLVIEQMKEKEFRNIALLDGQCGMTFYDFVERYAQLNWIFDIKPESGAKTLQALKDWAVRKNAESMLVKKARFLLWRRDHEKLLHKFFPAAVTLANKAECQRAGISVLMGLKSFAGLRQGRTYAVPPRFMGQELFAQSFFEAYHSAGARVLAYLPEREEDVLNAQHAGADEILINGKPIRI